METRADGGACDLVWMDLRQRRANACLRRAAANSCRALPVEAPEALHRVIEEAGPRGACFHFDLPEEGGLALLAETRRRRPDLPLLMVTGYHSEELAVWALRNRVWDYLVEPVPEGDLSGRIADLLEGLSPAPPLAPALPHRPPTARARTGAALAHLESHYAEPLSLDHLAALCGLSRYQFSRAFHREQGQPLQEYLLALRVTRARALLVGGGVSVTAAAVATGFTDVSYFSRVFKRHWGVSPRALMRAAG